MSAKLFALLTLTVIGLTQSASQVNANIGQEGHGGHPLLVEFSAQGKQLYHVISQLQQTGLNLSAAEKLKLKEAVFNTRLEFIDEDIPNPKGEGTVLSRVIKDTQPGREGKMVIQFSRAEDLRSYMAPRRSDYIEISRYVLHEYLLAADFQDDVFQISSLFKMPTYNNTDNIKVDAIVFDKYVYVPILPLRSDTTYWNAKQKLLDQAKDQIFEWLLSSEAIVRAQINPILDIDFVYEGVPKAPTSVDYVTSSMYRITSANENLSMHWDRVVGLGVSPRAKISLRFALPEGFVANEGPGVKSAEYSSPKPTNDSSFAAYSAAIKNAYNDTERRCAEWIDSIREKSGESYVFAHCRLFTLKLRTNPKNVNEDIVTAEVGTTYYLMSRWQKPK